MVAGERQLREVLCNILSFGAVDDNRTYGVLLLEVVDPQKAGVGDNCDTNITSKLREDLFKRFSNSSNLLGRNRHVNHVNKHILEFFLGRQHVLHSGHIAVTLDGQLPGVEHLFVLRTELIPSAADGARPGGISRVRGGRKSYCWIWQ